MLHKPEKDDFIGRMRSTTLRIDLNTDYSTPIQEVALVHEVLHAISSICALELAETQVAPLAALLHQFILQVEK